MSVRVDEYFVPGLTIEVAGSKQLNLEKMVYLGFKEDGGVVLYSSFGEADQIVSLLRHAASMIEDLSASSQSRKGQI